MLCRGVLGGLSSSMIWTSALASLIFPAYITTYALSKGLEASFAYQLVAILNGASVLGRALPGFVADRWGRYNVMILSSSLCAILVLDMSLSASSNFAALFGLCSGTAYNLPPVCISQLFRTDAYASLYGTAYSLVHLCLGFCQGGKYLHRLIFLFGVDVGISGDPVGDVVDGFFGERIEPVWLFVVCDDKV